jgi:hypothetical protein
MTKPTQRDVTNILGYSIKGWNDKRKYYNRIKFIRALTDSEQAKLVKGLTSKFPEYMFTFRKYAWHSPIFSKTLNVTVVYFQK